MNRFCSWLLSIIRSRFIDRGRRADARPKPEELPPQLPQQDGKPDDPESELILAGLAKLPPEQKELLSLFYLDGLNLRETGEVLGIPDKAVRQRLYRARMALRRALERHSAPQSGEPVTAGEGRSGGDLYGT